MLHLKKLRRQNALLRVIVIAALLLLLSMGALAQMSPKPVPVDTVIKNGTILTVPHGVIHNGSILIHNGKIAEVGQSVTAPPNAVVIDATGKFVMPGIIDSHSHSALDSDVNEATSPVTPQMIMQDAFDYTDKAIYHSLAGG